MKRIFLPLLAFSILILSAGVISAQAEKTKPLPKGNWTFSATPYFGKDWKTIPVDVYSVTSNMELGGLIEKVKLRNLTKTRVTGVALTWILNRDGKPVNKGETTMLTTFVQPGRTVELSAGVVEFSQVTGSYLENGTLQGDYSIQVFVSKIEFEDGNTWKTGDPGTDRAGGQNDEGGGCAHQECKWDPNTSTYFCNVTGEPTFCSVTQNGNSCTVTRCPPNGD